MATTSSDMVIHKDRLIQQFKDSRPLGMNIEEDLEDVESEVTLMILEGIDISQVTVRDILRRLGVLSDGSRRNKTKTFKT